VGDHAGQAMVLEVKGLNFRGSGQILEGLK
jgi:hypothetical protein